MFSFNYDSTHHVFTFKANTINLCLSQWLTCQILNFSFAIKMIYIKEWEKDKRWVTQKGIGPLMIWRKARIKY